MELLHFAFGILSYVLRSIVCLDALLDSIIGVTASVTDADLGIFGITLDLLDELATAIFGEGRNAETDEFTIVLGSNAKGRSNNRTLDVTDDTLLYRLGSEVRGYRSARP